MRAQSPIVRDRADPVCQSRATRHRRRAPRQDLQERGRRRRHLVCARAGLDHRPARRQRRRQDHHDRHDPGADHPDLGNRARARRRDAAPALSRAPPHEFREPLCRHAGAAHHAPEPHRVRHAVRGGGRGRAGRGARGRARSRRAARSADRKAFRRPEDARVTGQGAGPPPGDSAAPGADRFARPRHRGLGAGANRALPARPRRHHPARLPQHGRGRAAVRAGHHHEKGPHRGRRHAASAARALRAAHARGSVPRRRPRPDGSKAGRAMSAHAFPRAFSPRRIASMVLRYWYLLRSSWPRLLELIYWPAVQMLMWGFLQLYIAGNAGFFARAGGTFIGAVLLWDILFRGQLGFSISFLEEMWARNLANLMISPLRTIEFVGALMIMSLIRLAIGMGPVSLLAIAFFGFNLYGLGLALAAFFVNLILTSWAIGILVSGLVLRNGLGAESLAWTIMFLLLPLTCVYYPVTILPHWLQAVAWALPPTYVFEGIRELLINHVFRADLMVRALALNAAFFALAVAGFIALLDSARRQGSLLQTGE